MKNDISLFRLLLVFIIIMVITMIHNRPVTGNMEVHILHRELYFIPILLASFWFGLKLGLVASLTVSLFYAPQMIEKGHSMGIVVFSQILIFNLVAIMLGYLVDRRNKQHIETMKMEKYAVLGRAAGIIGHEMTDLLNAIKSFADPSTLDSPSEGAAAFGEEMNRLTKMVENLSAFMPDEKPELRSTDLNEVIRDRIIFHEKAGTTAGNKLEAELDPKGCPSLLDMERIGRVLDSLIRNACEVSPSGKSIQILSQRDGTSCRVEVRDHGPGIRPEHQQRIFTPFFTTKPDGHGLDLAACRKSMLELGGEIHFESEWGKGACFILYIPREP